MTPVAVLRPWRRADAPALVVASADPELARQLGGVRFSDVEDAAAFIASVYRLDDRSRNWAVVEADGGSGAVLGNVAVTSIEHTHGTAWVSYWLLPRARGRGLATRALVAAVDDAVALGVHRLELGHRTNNPASCAVATRAGFSAEGIEREKLRYGEERFDVETHARLATDPRPAVVPLPFRHDAP
ncbi:GNAT family N-acetyltransferase [Curtobacterium sp. 22159]|uniref:GNAT family N-acetyltransferase n=1 Tax=Curtobacterium sp. 22159 TaxID=3453882 RepID=UPI003F841E72